MTRPASFDGGRVVALGGNGKLVSVSLRLALMTAALGAVASCGRQEPAAAPTSDRADAGVRVKSSALVTSPATWQNLWGSWPAARYDEPISYDKDRKKIVMFAGRYSTQGPYYDDTWEWDGARASWNEKTPTGMKPAERAGHMMVYDTERKKTFMFSGWQPGAGFYIPDQWEWDGLTATWTERVLTTAQPSARYGGSLVWDPDRKRAVLFGGFDEATGRRNDLWEWDGSTWTDRTPAGTKPAARWNHTAAYDSVRKKLVVYGGNTGTGLASAGTYVDETWEWDGTAATWTKIATPTSVVYYYYGNLRMAYDAAHGKTFMYYNYNTVYEYDPATPAWTLVAPAPTRTDPSSYPGNLPSLAYDPDRGVTVMFGGQSDRTLTEYVGADKVFNNRSTPINGPIQRQDPCIAFDSKAGKLMLFGGYSNVDGLYKQDTWQWSGTDQNWTNKTNANAKPPARRGGMMVYDSKRDQLILFGGYGSTYFQDVWTWSSTTPNWTQQTISGTQPAATYNNQMFYDVARDKVILFENYYTIWELDPATFKWTQRLNTTTGIPTSFTQRGYYEVTFDTDRSKLLFVGGYGYDPTLGTVYDADVWEWDTTTGLYTERPTAVGVTQPPGRRAHGVSYDSARRVVVMFGGYVQVTGKTGDSDDSWEWDGISGKWSETTPPGVRPLPRENHLQIFDSVRATTLIFGGSVPNDTTYGPQEIWQYIASSAPRPNGSGCSPASAATCASGNCVDGVCCAQTAAQCNGTCKACNVPGMLGTCSDVPVNSTDDTCASDQACDATHLCKARIGTLCSVYTDCATGHCADGVCCDSDCNGTCKVCNLNNKRGTCSQVQTGLEDPGTCVSDMSQPRFCDTTGVCTNDSKATGKPCTAGGQCKSSYCIDGFCCGSPCNNTCYSCGNPGAEGICTAITAGLPDHSATTACDGATQYCTGGGACGMDKKANGNTCTVATDCGSGFCVDGLCCNSTCTGVCQACNVAGSLGKCVNVAPGTQDTNSTPACAGEQYCDAAATCQSGLKANGLTCSDMSQCGSKNCVDGVCCDSACGDTCYACNLPGTVGTCSGLTPGSTDGVACKAPQYCSLGHACTIGKKANGTTCVGDTECGSNLCVDGVCCESSCTGDCRSCAIAGSLGSCVAVPDGMDPRKKCQGNNAVCSGTCNGQGACRFPAQGAVCEPPGCSPSTGFITNGGTCDGAGHCSAVPSRECNGFRCYTDPQGMAQCGKDCAHDPECALDYYCSAVAGDGGVGDGGVGDGGTADAGAGASCPKVFDLGHACDRNTQCGSGTCSDGVCCDNDCNKCGSCNLPGTVGHCVPVAAGTDPNNDCIDSASDPSGKCGGMCDGHARCLFPAAGTTCGTCKACNGGGLCNIKPEDDDACGTIHCDTLTTSCAQYHDLTTKRCGALGTCKVANNAASCTDVTNLCGPDGGAGGAGGGAGSGAGGGSGASGTTGKNDGSTDGKTGGSGGGCGCDVGGTGLPGLPMVGLLLGIVLTARRRRR
ncbi:MAG: uncharacterized protein JWM82_1586 [Myxococcales bacterium]|nr:uncharacterized protein [Myxococcales bacterium]